MKKKSFRNIVAQFALPFFTIIGYAAISLKLPGRGLLVNLISQPFWIYSSWKAYKEAGQIGILITTFIITIIVILGIINYRII